MSLSASLNGSQGSGGSVNNAYSVGQGQSSSFSDSWSRTYGSEATAKSYAEAERATARQEGLMNTAMEYNAREAYAQRAFNEMMGNSIYTRSVKNMIEAGINPILAANMGLSGAAVNSGAAASISTPSAFMGQTFADQASASHAESQSSWSTKSESSGSGWQNSESGLATGLQMMGSAISGALEKIGAGQKIDIALKGLDKVFNQNGGNADKAYSDLAGTIAEATGQSKSKVKDKMMTKDSGRYKAQANAYSKEPLYKYKGKTGTIYD